MPALLLKFLPQILMVVSALGILGYFYAKGRTDVTREIENKDLKVTIKDQEALNEIRNNRGTNDDLFDSLLNGTF